MKLVEFANSLRPHDASIAIALRELVEHADENGVLDRGDWIAALQAAYRELDTGSAGTGTELSELGPYIEQNILGRLESEGFVSSDPPGEGWERVRLQPAIWQEVIADRPGTVADLEATVRNLLVEPEKRGPASTEIATKRSPGGSSLAASGLLKAYRRRKVVNDVDINVSQGEIVGLLGPNGAGKTTTFYMIVGLITPDEGRVYLDNQELTGVPMYQRARRGIGYLAQEPSIFRKLTVEENILAILETLPLSKDERRQRLERVLDELGIKHLRKNKAYSLSGGERRRLEITRALVSEPKFMLLDEPFAGVDPIAVHDIQQIVSELRERNIGVIISDHNVEQTLDIVDRAYIMYDGRVRVSGTVAELVWSEEVAEIYFGPTLTARMRERYERPEALVE